MARALTIVNVTHWKTSDISRIIRAAIAEAKADPKKRRVVSVRYQPKGSRAGIRVDSPPESESLLVEIWLPKRGPKVTHPNALVALAASGIDADTPMLAVSDSYFIANALANQFARGVKGLARLDLRSMRNSISPPPWTNATKMVITKYADPAKDGAYVEFVQKKQVEIERAQCRIDTWQESFDRAKRNLDRAKRDKKKAEKAIVDAKKRRAS